MGGRDIAALVHRLHEVEALSCLSGSQLWALAESMEEVGALCVCTCTCDHACTHVCKVVWGAVCLLTSHCLNSGRSHEGRGSLVCNFACGAASFVCTCVRVRVRMHVCSCAICGFLGIKIST